MVNLHSLAESWLAWMTAASWQLALLIGIVAALCSLARGASARLRHGLWSLVLVKALLPPQLASSWGIGHLALRPLSQRLGWPSPWAAPAWQAAEAGTETAAATAAAGGQWPLTIPVLLLVAWAVGMLAFLLAVVWRYARLMRLIRRAELIDEGPLRVALERIALELGVGRVPELYRSSEAASPFLIGTGRPAIVLPAHAARWSDAELRTMLTHELVHYERWDTWVGWLQVFVQAAFWFHPLVWWANRQLRHARECACDEDVLRFSAVEPQQYFDTVVRALSASRGRTLSGGSLVGVFERGIHIEQRLESIMQFQPRGRRSGWAARLVVAAAALFLLPMSSGAKPSTAADNSPPRMIKAEPGVGAVNVDPGLKEIVVTFDRDMQKGMSWTGGPPEFPPLDDSRKPAWKDTRTCVLPVKLEAGKFYRLGINSKSHTNFKSAAGVTAQPATLYFTTRGASAAVQAQARTPQVVRLVPANDADAVDPRTSELRVTFNMPMGGGMSWTGGGPTFPRIPDGKQATWSKDRLTCTLPVQLEPGREYRLGLNSASHQNFQSASGVPLQPVVYAFRTRGE